jgi:hypothetical protein
MTVFARLETADALGMATDEHATLLELSKRRVGALGASPEPREYRRTARWLRGAVAHMVQGEAAVRVPAPVAKYGARDMQLLGPDTGSADHVPAPGWRRLSQSAGVSGTYEPPAVEPAHQVDKEPRT